MTPEGSGLKDTAQATSRSLPALPDGAQPATATAKSKTRTRCKLPPELARRTPVAVRLAPRRIYAAQPASRLRLLLVDVSASHAAFV
jgi:hypothetical protein